MQVRCIRAFGNAAPGDIREVPDGAAVDPEHWEIMPPPEPEPAPAEPGPEGK